MKNLKAVPEANSAGTIFSKDLEHFIYELNFDAFREEELSFVVTINHATSSIFSVQTCVSIRNFLGDSVVF